MAKVISVTSGKGGTGKSSVCVGLAMAFAEMGRKVMILELDIGLRCVDIMLGVENQVVYDLGDVIAGNCSLEDAVIKTDRFDTLDYIAAPAVTSSDLYFYQLPEYLRILRRSYDYVMIDTSAGLDLSLFYVRSLSDLALIVTTPDPVCIRGGGRAAALMEEADFLDYRLIINRVSKDAVKKSSVHDLDDVIDGVGAQLLGVVPENSSYRYCMERGLCPEEQNMVKQVFAVIAKRLEGNQIPLLIERL